MKNIVACERFKMNIIKKNTTILVLTFCACMFLGFSPSSSDGNEGFYLNRGKDKIESLDCYSFDDLMVKFPILPEMMGYDKVYLEICKNSGNVKCIDQCFITYSGSVFTAKYQNKSIGELTFFRKGEQRNCLDSDPNGSLNRYSLKNTVRKKSLTDATLQLRIKGYTITGYSEEISGNRIIQKPIYSRPTLIYEGEELPLTNRVKISLIQGLGDVVQNVDLSVPCDSTTVD